MTAKWRSAARFGHCLVDVDHGGCARCCTEVIDDDGCSGIAGTPSTSGLILMPPTYRWKGTRRQTTACHAGAIRRSAEKRCARLRNRGAPEHGKLCRLFLRDRSMTRRASGGTPRRRSIGPRNGKQWSIAATRPFLSLVSPGGTLNACPQCARPPCRRRQWRSPCPDL